MDGAFVRIARVRAHQKCPGGDVAEGNSLLDDGKSVEEGPAGLGNLGILRRESEGPVVRSGGATEIALTLESPGKGEETPSVAGGAVGG